MIKRERKDAIASIQKLDSADLIQIAETPGYQIEEMAALTGKMKQWQTIGPWLMGVSSTIMAIGTGWSIMLALKTNNWSIVALLMLIAGFYLFTFHSALQTAVWLESVSLRIDALIELQKRNEKH